MTTRMGVLLLLTTALSAAEPPSFTKDIAPILAANCTGCHSAKLAIGKLVLDSFASIQEGGPSGPIIAPGKSADSLLFERITGKVTPSMPLNGKKLADGEIELIRKWIDAGAPPPAAGEVATVRGPVIPDIKPRVPVKPLIGALAYRPDGKLLALGTFKEVQLVDPDTGKLIATFAGEAEDVRAVAFSSDGKLLAAAGGLPARCRRNQNLGRRKTRRTAHHYRPHRLHLCRRICTRRQVAGHRQLRQADQTLGCRNRAKRSAR